MNRESATTICPLCGGQETETFIKIEEMPVFCNVLWPTRRGAEEAQRGDLHLAFCATCTHIFNAAFDPSLMSYAAEYENSLHFSPRFQAYANRLVDGLIERYDLRGKRILEIGAGQGDFLEMVVERGGNRGIAFDPSYVEEGTPPENIEFVKDYYGAKYADVEADFVACRHVFEHVEEPASFMQTVRTTVGAQKETVVFFEVPNVLYTLRHEGIWDIIYEHCSYFNPLSLQYAFRQAGFDVLATEEVFGQQFLTIEGKPAGVPATVTLDAAETSQLASDVERFGDLYAGKVAQWRQRLEELVEQGGHAVVWGAGSKGVTFINIMNDVGAITHAVDINPRKKGMFVAGAGLEIVDPDALRETKPDLVIIMNGNYLDEIKQQLRDLDLDAAVLLA